jgi:hypothetical protein
MCLKSLYQIDETWRQFLWSLGEKNTLLPLFFVSNQFFLYNLVQIEQRGQFIVNLSN